MIGLIQRVSEASVNVAGNTVGAIGPGILILLGVEKDDTQAEVEKLANKLCNYRIFSDADGKMNLNIRQVEGSVLVVSQFTLVADTSRGNRPGFSRGAPPALGNALYEAFIAQLESMEIPVASGQFGADMQVQLINDGPVTFHIQV
ncbi:D-aminoacyl-tRNA deacylase [Alteromonas lipolytica]|uniref:D-aminoacyl-tRNA deacylase n=1 Tax=Alteromonas lipolytica TaxID=1856405 RepID=A0A1E8F8T3_9ALTE|nr:D-aminoacyl-tRNA deacylase [Alteromonas lipolytica]OFI32331.1 D-tyrosyl-tRNA(Tyr) deacylase [Alteromonas lipolytica]GGF85385.1 D-aminoacyl-tRNA deacylase [Alteromonas lipolytica]